MSNIYGLKSDEDGEFDPGIIITEQRDYTDYKLYVKQLNFNLIQACVREYAIN